MGNPEDTYTRCNKYSSKLDISRSFIRIFALNNEQDLVKTILVMRVLIQRVKKASVTVNQELISLIDNGLLIFIGIGEEDNAEDIGWLTKKIANIRLFDDENGVMNRSVIDIDGEILAVSQFTLMASTKKGNRPSYIKAAKPEISIPLYEQFCTEMEIAINKPIKRGVFGADMKVELLNDGPVTIFIDSKNRE